MCGCGLAESCQSRGIESCDGKNAMCRNLCASGEGAGQLIGGLATNAPTSLAEHFELLSDWSRYADNDSGKRDGISQFVSVWSLSGDNARVEEGSVLCFCCSAMMLRCCEPLKNST